MGRTIHRWARRDSSTVAAVRATSWESSTIGVRILHQPCIMYFGRSLVFGPAAGRFEKNSGSTWQTVRAVCRLAFGRPTFPLGRLWVTAGAVHVEAEPRPMLTFILRTSWETVAERPTSVWLHSATRATADPHRIVRRPEFRETRTRARSAEGRSTAHEDRNIPQKTTGVLHGSRFTCTISPQVWQESCRQRPLCRLERVRLWTLKANKWLIRQQEFNEDMI